MFFAPKKSDFLPGMLLGVAVGGVVCAGTMLMTDKKNRDSVKRTAEQLVKKASGVVNNILS